MLRLSTTAQGFCELWKCSHFVASSVTRRKAASFLPVSSARHHRPPILAQRFSTGSPVWKDSLQPKADTSTRTVDLDKWKSVMRSQAASEEKVSDEEEASDEDENLKEPGGDLQDGSSSLAATRDLVAMWRQAGKVVPQEISDEELKTLAELTTKSARKKYLKYLAIKEAQIRSRKAKQQQKKAERETSIRRAQESDEEDGGDQKGPKNTFLLQFWSRSLDKLLAWRAAQAMMFGQPLVFDLSYDSHMSRQEVENTVSQLMEVEGWNRRATEPFHLHFCNLQADGAYKQQLVKRYGAEPWDRLLITSTDRQHVDVFPREQLVYLTADSPNVLRSFDHSKVYIIGALVDRSIQSGLSLANAKRLKLATARLPLDEFLHWEMGAKNLTLDQMMRIMLTLKETGNWEEALKFVPKRKHDGFYPQQQKKITNDRFRGNHGPREDGDGRSRSGERIFKNEDRSLYRPRKEFGLTGRDRMAGPPGDGENKPAASRVRTSFQSNVEGRKIARKGKMWWDNE